MEEKFERADFGVSFEVASMQDLNRIVFTIAKWYFMIPVEYMS